MSNLQQKVHSVLMDHPNTQDAAIEVVNTNGIITLSGTVSDREISDAAESTAKDVEGVVSVVNEIQVKGNTDEDKTFDIPEAFGGDVVSK